MTGRIGLFGGSFDPIHFGHLIAARSIAEQLQFESIVLIPAPRPPHKAHVVLANAADRLELVRLAVEGDPLFSVSDIECQRTGPSYTLDTVNAFHAACPNADLAWIVGADSLPELPSWYRIADLVRRVRIVTAVRPGWSPPPRESLVAAVGDEPASRLIVDCIETPAVAISATDIRRRVKNGQSIRFLVPEAVRSYIDTRGLYR
jgi:nicotinate-nucleotide adenylyltransferase